MPVKRDSSNAQTVNTYLQPKSCLLSHLPCLHHHCRVKLERSVFEADFNQQTTKGFRIYRFQIKLV